MAQVQELTFCCAVPVDQNVWSCCQTGIHLNFGTLLAELFAITTLTPKESILTSLLPGFMKTSLLIGLGIMK